MSTPPPRPKLIEVALPLEAINQASIHDMNIRQGHPSSLHLWWARRPLPAARAVIWASLVDDPLAHPDRFPTEEDQILERKRLFGILERIVDRNNANNPQVLEEAKEAIESSDGTGGGVSILDPFCGRGIIPLEAQRLGLAAYGGDLNPVPVLISKAITEFPVIFAHHSPVNPSTRTNYALHAGERAQGLAADIQFYGEWMRARAQEAIGKYYPREVIAWIWARTVQSPDPAWRGNVPLVNSWILRKPNKNNNVVWVEPMVDYDKQNITYQIRSGGTPTNSTKRRCVATNSPIELKYIRDQGKLGKLKRDLLAIVLEGQNTRQYVNPTEMTDIPKLDWIPSDRLVGKSASSVPLYGMTTWGDLFTKRQLLALNTFSDLLSEVRTIIEQDAISASFVDDRVRLRDGGLGASAYADAVVTYLALAIDKLADLNNSLVLWESGAQCPRHLFGRHDIPMIWDFAEANPLGSSSGSWKVIIEGIVRAFKAKDWPTESSSPAIIKQQDAVTLLDVSNNPIVCTDPPYYDMVQYADLSDFFYVWLRRNLSDIWPEECATLLTPKKEELVANEWRAGSKEAAQNHFEQGMAKVMNKISNAQNQDFPATIFYAYKQKEKKSGETVSTGWETFLQGIIDAGLQVTAIWPIHSETTGRMIAQGAAALSSSVVLTCRPRDKHAPLQHRAGFIAALRDELPGAFALLQEQAIPPVDMAQSAIGPGMRIFSRHARVVEAGGSTMLVRTALTLINMVLEEILSAEETELDADSRFALTWYRQYGWEAGPFGNANTLAQAMNTAVDGVVDAGVVESKGGKVRLLRRKELDTEWDPRTDRRLTVWELTQHLIARMEMSEAQASELLAKAEGGTGDQARHLAYLLYKVADSRNSTEDAVAYNSLVTAWESISQEARRSQGPTQTVIPT